MCPSVRATVVHCHPSPRLYANWRNRHAAPLGIGTVIGTISNLAEAEKTHKVGVELEATNGAGFNQGDSISFKA
eukprot:7455507-Prorocentrum_lima.AAC.1